MGKNVLFVLCTVIVLGIVLAIGDEIDPYFVREYFQEKNLKQAVVIACWNHTRILSFFRVLIDSGVQVTYSDISESRDIRSLLKVNYYKLAIVLDLNCPGKELIFNEVISKIMSPFNETFFWLLVSRSNRVPIEFLANLPLIVSTEMTLSLYQNETYILYDIYNPSYRHGGKTNITLMGFWNKSAGLKILLDQYKYDRRGDFHGMTLNFSVAYIQTPEPDLETYMKTAINPHRDSLSRYHYALVLQLKDMYNFSIHMTKAETWGYMVNGSFNGILGEMIAGIVDVSASPFLYTSDRIHVCDWTVQTYYARVIIMLRHPHKNEYHNVFLKPFSRNVWWTVVLFGIIYWLILSVMIRIEWNFGRSKNAFSNPNSGTAVVIMAALTQQGSHEIPEFSSSRLFCFSLFICGLLVNQFYSASIVGSLLAEPPQFINTVHDLMRTNLEFGIEDVVYNHNFLLYPPDDRARAMKKRVQKNSERGKSSFFNASEGIRRVKDGNFAFLVDIDLAYKIIEETFLDNEICDLVEIEAYTRGDLGLITSKHSPFKKMIIYGLRKTVSSGITKRHRTIWHHRKPHCPSGLRSLPVPVHFQELYPAIILLLAGFCSALIALLMEKFTIERLSYHSSKDHKERNN